MSKVVTEVDIRQIYKWSKQKLIEELRSRLHWEIIRAKQVEQLKAERDQLKQRVQNLLDEIEYAIEQSDIGYLAKLLREYGR